MVELMLRILRKLLLVLVAFAIIGGTTSELARSAQYSTVMAMAGMPCEMTMPAADADHGKSTMPCKGMTSDCMKLMGCIADTSLPARFVSHEFVAHVSKVDYWSALSKLAGLVATPEPLPPRTI
jgi:hypothetical protein